MRLSAIVMVFVLLGEGALADSSADEQARRLLEDGRAYYSQGKFKQALDNFNTIVSGFLSTPSASAALLEIGRYRLEVEGNAEKGRAAFEDVAQRFPQSDGAPGAYYYLGTLTLNRATTPAELDDALAQFNRVPRLYPRSDWVPKALYQAGLVHRKAGRIPDAIDAERRVALEYPTSDAAPAAQFQVAHCLGIQGEPRAAMEEFQRVRNRYPDSEWAALALDRLSALYRLFGGGKITFARDPGYSIGSGDVLRDVRALTMTSDSTLWIASEKIRSAVPYDRTGKIGASYQAEELKSLSLTPKGDIVVASRLAVRIGKDLKSLAIPSDKPGVPEPLEHIEAATLTSGGSLLVADSKKKRVFRFDAKFQFQGSFPDAKERQISRMIQDGEGGIIFLDREEKVIQVFDEGGHMLRSLKLKGAAYDVRKPVDIASDNLRDLYVADEEGGVLVFSAGGQLLTSITGEDLKHPKALTLDATGAVLVYEDHAQRVLRFQ